MTLALYRKYRPRSFAEIIGQEQVTEPLSQALRTGRLHHAYLFSGPRGCGKTSSARILARSLNCEKGPTPDPCGECDSCRALAPDGPGSIDVIEIDAASHGGVDDARDLRERAFFAPVASRYKVYVIDEAHMVSSAGFNALLKLVEEPPDYVKFVFATTEPEKVLGTIKSRTHHYPFRPMPPGVLRPYLERLCAAEGIAVEPAVFPLVVRAGGGFFRDTLSILDQLIAGADPEGVTYARAVGLLGVTDVALLDEVCDALAAGDGAAVYETINRVVEAGHDARRFAGDLLERLRNLIVLQQVPDAVAKGLLDGADDELSRMAAQAERFGPATLSRMADIVHTGLTDMRGTTAPRLVLELIAARMLLPGADDDAAALLARIERVERHITSTEDPGVRPTPPPPAPATGPAATASAPPVTTPAEPPSVVARDPHPPASPSEAQSAAHPTSTGSQTAPPTVTQKPPAIPPAPPSGSAPAGALDAIGVRRRWEEVAVAIKRRSGPVLAAMVRDATVREVNGSTLVLRLMHVAHLDRVTGSRETLQSALEETFGGAWTVRLEIGDGTGTPAPARSAASRGADPAPVGGAQASTIPEPEHAPDDNEDWPEIARPGGSVGPAGAVRRSPEVDPPAPGWPSAERSPDSLPAAPNPPDIKAPAKARSASAGRKRTSGGAADRQPRSTGGGARPDTAGARGGQGGEPGSQISGLDASAHVGFDPGDEPLDDELHATASSEQQALDLLRTALGAERIADGG